MYIGRNMKLRFIKGYIVHGEISGSRGGEYEMIVLWDVAPCSLVEVYRHFRGASCLHH
jgi:hypothetical protein